MVDTGKLAEERARWKSDVRRVFGSAPWLRAKEVRHYRAKIFKSGNSLALRLPASLGLSPGQEMDLRVEDGESFSFEPVQRTPRKFNIDKVWASGSSLEMLKPEDRVFQARPLFDRPAKASDEP